MDAPDAPLVLSFNGGHGVATSGILMLYGTGPTTLDVPAAADAGPTTNPSSYTRFANLLFIDERMAGFSYGLDGPGGCVDGPDGFLEDAADYLHALLDFFDTHESLRGRAVALAGESYGAARAAAMLYLVQHYAADDNPLPQLPDLHARVPWLRQRVQAHFDLLDPARVGAARTPAEVARQFRWAIMIQGGFGGSRQLSRATDDMVADPAFAAYVATPDAFSKGDIRHAPQWDLDSQATRRASRRCSA